MAATNQIKHYTIPIFIPQLGCPFQCIFCDQERITSRAHVPDAIEMEDIINRHLLSFPKRKKHVEIGIFGGNFTGLDIQDQEHYLQVAYKHLESGRVQGIRLSTRPDYIDEPRLNLLKKYGVTTIELGAQSMDEEVLIEAARGHTALDIESASRMITAHGFRLGLQMMLGLPGDTLQKAVNTVKQIIDLGASETRIYPVLVIRGTKLEEWYGQGKYNPLSLEETILWLKELIPIFESSGVEITRIGLHSSVGLSSGRELVAGPFHPSIRELAMTEVWWDKLDKALALQKADRLQITVHPEQYNFAIGYYGKNRKKLLKNFSEVLFLKNDSLEINAFRFEMASHDIN